MKKILGIIILSIALSSAVYAANEGVVEADDFESVEDPIILETQLEHTEPTEGSVEENVEQ